MRSFPCMQLAAFAAAAAATSATPAAALGPIAGGMNDAIASMEQPLIQQTQYQRYGRGGYRGGYYRGGRYYGGGYYNNGGNVAGAAIAGGILGLATGAIIAGSAANAAPPPPPGADPNWVAYCARKYQSFDPGSGTYLAYDGNRYVCQ
ncbi:BA14K family protein [Methylocella silvestris BL2]|uniref:Lectin-like protein BA14k n=1 Tax=Methylocella silvestris (strain DSM 15510 / CIP 108128 / LMG 27833 / NCIMB 13906 / BL2) TaxID=395965 RepID=B8ES49_METSB|nr:BA14K family protein [Methylocella silvestris]ACK52264.1 BA14K family protein [Methylocella silvestris BL2]